MPVPRAQFKFRAVIASRIGSNYCVLDLNGRALCDRTSLQRYIQNYNFGAHNDHQLIEAPWRCEECINAIKNGLPALSSSESSIGNAPGRTIGYTENQVEERSWNPAATWDGNTDTFTLGFSDGSSVSVPGRIYSQFSERNMQRYQQTANNITPRSGWNSGADYFTYRLGGTRVPRTRPLQYRFSG